MFSIRTGRREECVDITGKVEEAVRQSGVQAGAAHIYVPHATAAIVINEGADAGVAEDLIDLLRKLVPPRAGYRHDRIDGNADAHLKAAILGPSEWVPIRGGRLALGTWQRIFLVELDGPKTRKIDVTILRGGFVENVPDRP